VEETRYRIEFYNQKVSEDLKDLPKESQSLIKRAFDKRLKIDPVKLGKPLRGLLIGKKSLRVSIYRVIYTVDPLKKIVTIIAVDYRRDVYD
jgi:mRNA interferase RelE/StbE